MSTWGSSISSDPSLNEIGDNRGDVEADHPFRSEGIRLFDVVVELQLNFKRRVSEVGGFRDNQVQGNSPVLAFPVVVHYGNAADGPTAARQDSEQ